MAVTGPTLNMAVARVKVRPGDAWHYSGPDLGFDARTEVAVVRLDDEIASLARPDLQADANQDGWYDEEADRYFAWMTYIPMNTTPVTPTASTNCSTPLDSACTSFPDPPTTNTTSNYFHIILQTHDSNSPPPVSFQIRRDDIDTSGNVNEERGARYMFALALLGQPPADGCARSSRVWPPCPAGHEGAWTMQRGVWHRFVLRIKFHSSDGAVDLWKDGALVFSRVGIPTLFDTRGAYVKRGLYRQAWDSVAGVRVLEFEETILHSELKVALTRADAEFLAYPAISGLGVSSISTSGAVVSWSTAAPASTMVNYGTSTAYGNVASDPNQGAVPSHAIGLAGLSPGTTYFYEVVSSNEAGTASATGSFVTTATYTGSVKKNATSRILYVTLPQVPTSVLGAWAYWGSQGVQSLSWSLSGQIVTVRIPDSLGPSPLNPVPVTVRYTYVQ